MTSRTFGDSPPVLNKNVIYTQWKREVLIWQLGTSVEDKKQASRVFSKLEGKVRDFASRLSLEELGDKDGVKKLIAHLDVFHKKDEAQTLFIAIERLEKYYRGQNESIQDYIEEFGRRIDQVNELITGDQEAYQDAILAYRLLKQASLSAEDQKIVRATVFKLTYNSMVEALKKTIGDCVVNSSSVSEGSSYNNNNSLPIKSEPLDAAYYGRDEEYASQDTSNQFYSNYRGSGKYHGSQSSNYWGNQNSFKGNVYQKKYDRGNSGYRDNKNKSKHGQISKFTQNPIDQSTGEPYSCHVCNSTYHFKQECPESSYGGKN